MFDVNGKKLIRKLQQKGFQAYFIGGCVRDNVIGRPVYDYDITTNAKPEDIIDTFSGHKLVLNGLKHGTVGVVSGGKLFEITTFRIDGEYSDNRHPDKVTFSDDLFQDVLRRDFTINSIASDGKGCFIDYLGGLTDINKKIIKTCGQPKKRFQEDALRILRAMRFQSQLGFEIEENTHKAMLECSHLLKNISVERIYAELTKTLLGDYAQKALFNNSEVLFSVLPELKPMYQFKQNSLSHDLDVFCHTLKVLSLTPKDAVLRWTALLHDSGKPFVYVVGNDGYGHFYGHMKQSNIIATDLLKRLKAPKLVTKKVSTLCLIHDEKIDTEKKVKLMLKKYGKDLLDMLVTFKNADLMAHSQYGINKYKPINEKFVKLYNQVVLCGDCYLISDLKINGNDLKEKEIVGNYSMILNDVLDQVICGKLKNEKSELINYVCRKFCKNC